MDADTIEAGMTEKNIISSTELDALRQRFQNQSRKARTYYNVMHAARGMMGSDDAASAWMEKGLPAFDGKSPATLVSEGREEEVLAYIASLS
ncbi:MAG: antitoxin Xre/MbcA/ParS toxin-binding domain-containing protein [Burkholderiaceae bacterium]